jgi:hypothetical protein
VLLKGWSIWRAGELSIVHAVREAAGANFNIAFHALAEMQHCLCEVDLFAWESHPHRVRWDVHRLFKKAIGRVTPHRGGHHVTSHRVQ